MGETKPNAGDAYQRQLARWRERYYERQEYHVSRAREWNVRNKDRVYLNAAKSKYGLDAKGYHELYEAQEGRCGICRVHQSALPTRLCIDHDHLTLAIRGLLCKMCNAGLGAHERAGTGIYRWYLDWTPMMRLQKMKTLTDEERALWNW